MIISGMGRGGGGLNPSAIASFAGTADTDAALGGTDRHMVHRSARSMGTAQQQSGKSLGLVHQSTKSLNLRMTLAMEKAADVMTKKLGSHPSLV